MRPSTVSRRGSRSASAVAPVSSRRARSAPKSRNRNGASQCAAFGCRSWMVDALSRVISSGMLNARSLLASGAVGGGDREHVGLVEAVLGEGAVDRRPGRARRRRTARARSPHPPKPPPVIRAPIAPSPAAVSTARSSSGTEISKSSRIETCEASSRSPIASRSLLAQRAHRVEHALVLGDHVTHAAERLVVEQLAGARQVVDTDIAQRRDTEGAAPGLAGCPARRVAAGRVRVAHPGVDDEELETGGFEAERDDFGVEASGSRGTRRSRGGRAARRTGP